MIKVDLDRKIARLDPNIYGGFLEPIRTVVYGSIYDPKSPLADENGFRKDFIQLIKDLHIPVVRWPGGNYVSGYNWEDGIGPKDQRPARLDLAWHQIDNNQMGTDEYAKFCIEQSFIQDWDDGYMSEDMLKLNIWTPGLTGKRPVMVYFHGGLGARRWYSTIPAAWWKTPKAKCEKFC